MAERNPYLIARFWSKVDVGAWGAASCWPWKGAATAQGYGRFKIEHRLVIPQNCRADARP